MNSGQEMVLEHQLDAVTRVLSLFSDDKMTINNIFKVLSRAEDNARFVCGFVELNKHDDEKIFILDNLINRKLAVMDKDGFLNLTPEGKERSRKELPMPIEKSIKNNQCGFFQRIASKIFR